MTEWSANGGASQLTPQLPKNCCVAILFRLGPIPAVSNRGSASRMLSTRACHPPSMKRSLRVLVSMYSNAPQMMRRREGERRGSVGATSRLGPPRRDAPLPGRRVFALMSCVKRQTRGWGPAGGCRKPWINFGSGAERAPSICRRRSGRFPRLPTRPATRRNYVGRPGTSLDV